MLARSARRLSLVCLLGVMPLFGGVTFVTAADPAADTDPGPTTVAIPEGGLVLVVMDPLAAPLSCPCVQGYAQRDYTKLGEYLEQSLGQEVHVVFCESLKKATRDLTGGRADIVIGKQSVVEFDAAASKRDLQRVALLTGKDGSTTQTGLIVVPAADPAQSVSELAGYRIIFGPKESVEKHQAAIDLLSAAGVSISCDVETRSACDEGATLILELGASVRGAALISSYARPLLEGCGTVKKGDLRVVAETEPVPFVAAFVSADLDGDLRQDVQKALLSLGEQPLLCQALETQDGFVEPDTSNDEPKPETKERIRTAKKK